MKVKDNLDFGEFLAEWGVAQMEIFSIKRNLMQFINYVLRVHSFQQLFIWVPTLFRRFLYTDICLDITLEL